MGSKQRASPPDQMAVRRMRDHRPKCALRRRPPLLAQLEALAITIALLCASAASQAATTTSATSAPASTTTGAAAATAAATATTPTGTDQLRVSTTTLASASAGAARGVKRASQQPQQAPTSLASLLDQQQANVQSMMARPFYSIKDGKTSARRIQQQASLAGASPTQQRHRSASKARAETEPARQQATVLAGEGQPKVAQQAVRLQNKPANSGDDDAQAAILTAAGELQQVDINNDQLAGQQRQPTTQAADERQQQQQLANMMLIDSFNQLVSADGGQLTSDFSTMASSAQSDDANEQRAMLDDGLAASRPTSENEMQQQSSLATSSPADPVKQSGVDSGARTQTQPQTQPPSSLSMSLDGMIVNSRPRLTQGGGAWSSASASASRAQEASVAEPGGQQARAAKGAKQRAGANDQKSIGSEGRQDAAPPSTLELASGREAEGVERMGELPARADNSNGNLIGNGAETPTSFGAADNAANNGATKPANSRRVPFTGVPFSSPASKGQRTKPKASNQIGANLSSPFQVAKQQQQQHQKQQQQQQQQPQALQNEPVSKSGSGADQAVRPVNVAQMAPSGFDEEQQQLQQQQTEGDGLAAANNANSAESSQPVANKLTNGQMLMSLVSSSDGKERRLVMISRDTLASLQRFAAQQQIHGAGAQLDEKPAAQSAGASANSWWPASGQQAQSQDELQTTLGPQEMASSTVLPAPLNLGATSKAQMSAARGSTSSSPALTDAANQTARDGFASTTISSRFQQQLATTTTIAPTTLSTLTSSSGDESSMQRQSVPTRAGQLEETFREVSIGRQTSGVAKPQAAAKSQQTSAAGRQSGSAARSKQLPGAGAPKTSGKQNNRAKQNKQQQTAGSKSSSQQQVAQQAQQSNANGAPATPQNGGSTAGSQTGANSKPTTGNKGGRGRASGIKQQRQKSNQWQNGAKASQSPGTVASAASTRNKLVGKTGSSKWPTQQAAARDAPSKLTRPLSSGTGAATQSAPASQSAGQETDASTISTGLQQEQQQQQQQTVTTTTVAPSATVLTNAQQLADARPGANSASQQQSRQNSMGSKRPASWTSSSSSSSPRAPPSLLSSPTGNETVATSGPTIGSDASQKTSTLAPMSRGELDKQLDELERANAADFAGGSSDQSGQRAGFESSPVGSHDERASGGVFSNELDGLRATIPGEPLVDYPIYSRPPERTSFQCEAQSCPGGYYADLEAQCQVFHVCQNDGRMDTFLCPNGTIFSQQHFVCVWWWQVECGQSSKFYKLNDAIYCNSMNLPDDENLLTSVDNRRLPSASAGGQLPRGATAQDGHTGSDSQLFRNNQRSGGQQQQQPQQQLQQSQEDAFSTHQTDDSSLSVLEPANGSTSSTRANSDATTAGPLATTTTTTDASAGSQTQTRATPSDGRQTSQRPGENTLAESELNQQQQQQQQQQGF